jgi:hypothetical protein
MVPAPCDLLRPHLLPLGLLLSSVQAHHIYMRLLIRYLNGYGQDAILLAAMENRIRVAAPGRDDAVEFRFVEGHWISEALEPVEIEESPELDGFGWDGVPHAEMPALGVLDCAFGLTPLPDQPAAPAVN